MIHHLLIWGGYFLLACALLLFLGGMASAFIENRREKAATGKITRPGWQRSVTRDPSRATGLERAMMALGLMPIAMWLVARRTLKARSRDCG